MNRPRIALISNPRSTGNLAQLPRIRAFCAMHPDIFHYEVERADQIGEAMKTIAMIRPSVLAINGGDGTNHVVITAFIRTYGDEPLPAIAFLRGGTMNTTANACGVAGGSPRNLLSRLLDKLDGRLPLETVE